MTVKEYLSQVHDADKIIRAKHRQINMLKDRAERAVSSMAALKVCSPGSHSLLEDAVSKYVDLQAEVAGDIKRFYDLYREIGAVIAKVEDADHRALLTYRYLSFYSWEQIAAEMNYSLRQIYYLHGDALKKIAVNCS